jgi:uncharacterized membrane protein
MKQDAFIHRLRQALASLPKQEVDEIVADYREYLSDAIAAGRSEEDVVAALGDPDKLARELKAQATYRQWQARRSFGNLARVVTSIAGLGLLNVILLVPFMFYLLFLTVGYMVSSAFAIGGLVAVVAISSHHLFGWPPVETPSVHISAKTGHAASNSIPSDDDDTSDDATDLGDVKVEGDHFVLKLDDGSKASIVTRVGVVEMKNDGGALKVFAPGDRADKILKRVDNDTYQIRTDDVTSMEVKDDEGKSVSIAHASGNRSTLVWDVRDGDGSGRIRFERDASGNTHHLAVTSGNQSVRIDANKGIAISDDDSDIRIVAPMGWSLTRVAFGYALAMLVGGVLGLLVCARLTRATWRALSRYVHRQIDLLSARLDERGEPL